jgi:hypothetical protein
MTTNVVRSEETLRIASDSRSRSEAWNRLSLKIPYDPPERALLTP